MKKLLYILFVLIACGSAENVMAQNALSVSQATCYSNANVYSFTYNTHQYNIIKEAQTWTAAAACAMSDGGYLTEITTQAEQTAVYNAIVASGISSNYSAVSDGGGASYIWLGANDMFNEGDWWWDGDNDLVSFGGKFWVGQGAAGANNGAPFNSGYNNWGGKSTSTIQEPDDFGANQDALAIALGAWPYGIAGEWNDIAKTNSIYYVIEYNTIPTAIKQNSNNEIALVVYPNPATDKIHIECTSEITEIVITSIDGKILKTISSSQKEEYVDISKLNTGIYFLRIVSANNEVTTKKIIKN